MYRGYKIEAMRILPSDKITFPTDEDFKFFVNRTMIARGGYYYFPGQMMRCPNHTLVLFQHNGMIRAVGVLIDTCTKRVVDERGIEYAGYYEFDVSTLLYLASPIDRNTLREVYPGFKSFNQTKQIIPIEYLDNIVSLWDDGSFSGSITAQEISEEIEQLRLDGKSREAIVKIRVNQGVFRERLLSRYTGCCLCRMNNPALLIASHIKPWSESNASEKLDIDNGLLMCPNHDKLFDGGWISFDMDGRIMISRELSPIDRILLNISDDMRIILTEKNKEYLRYHIDHIFRR